MRLTALTAIFAATIVASCAPAGSGTFSTSHFVSSKYPYSVLYKGVDASQIAGRAWRLDNYRAGRSQLIAKEGDEYWVERSYDVDDDGKSDLQEREPFYEILLEHRETDASLWIRTVPMSNDDRNKNLRVFGERYVESAAGAGHIAVRFGAEVTVGVERRFASRVVNVMDCELAGRPAHVVDFEVANVDQLQLSESARWSRGRVAFIRTGYERVIAAKPGVRTKYPVLMIVGLSAAPADIVALSNDFDSLMDRIALGSGSKNSREKEKSGHTCKLQAAPPTISNDQPTAGGEVTSSPDAAPATSETAPAETAPAPAAPASTGP